MPIMKSQGVSPTSIEIGPISSFVSPNRGISLFSTRPGKNIYWLNKQRRTLWNSCGVLDSNVMTRVFLADSQPEIRSAFRLLLLDMNMQVVGESADWPTALTMAAGTQPDMLVVDWDLIPTNSSLVELRATCSAAVVIVLVSHLDARQQAALSAGADRFISKGESPERVTERLRDAAESVRTYP